MAENTDAEWIRALSEGGHDIVRITEFDGVDIGAPDSVVLNGATGVGRVLLTADQSDFADPPSSDHAGIIVVADVTRSGGEIRNGVRRLEKAEFDLSGRVVFLSDWL